jgi:hypothetical protein
MGCFYIGWLLQANLFQHGFLYHQVPPILLGIAIATEWSVLGADSLIARVNLILVLVLLVIMHPMLRWHRLVVWSSCLHQSSDAYSLKDLALSDMTDWPSLERVAAFLRAQDLRDSELTCYGNSTIPLYQELGIKPSTRFIEFSAFEAFFPGHAPELKTALERSPQRFIVTDVHDWWTARLPVVDAEAERPDQPMALPPAFPRELAGRFPWSEPIVFRAGRYYVHRVTHPSQLY